mmetsp:Transcript_2500/g.5144  ORF Transcript_2500/g.5144 Transcript_2500/m.5144 type:complete len:349 (-) Transcript_2500:273-1319(-)
MTNFTGIFTFPHGGMISAGLLLAACAALAATTYSVASCRLVVLSFISNTGNFEQTFSRYNQVEFDSFSEYKVALGLFQWLRPNGDDANWDDGTCVGYQQSMKDDFAEPDFEIARGFGSLAVLLSFIAVLWSFLNSCIAWNVFQIIILSFLLLSGTFASGMTFMFFRSDLCNSTFPESACRIDEGGLILVAGAILWFAGFLVTVLFVRPLDRVADDRGLTPYDRSQARESAAAKEKRRRARESRRQEQAKSKVLDGLTYEEEDGGIAIITPVTAASYSYDEEDSNSPRKQKASKKSSSRAQPEAYSDPVPQNDEYEVYINSRNQRIDEILRDIQDSEDREQPKSTKQEI